MFPYIQNFKISSLFHWQNSEYFRIECFLFLWLWSLSCDACSKAFTYIFQTLLSQLLRGYAIFYCHCNDCKFLWRTTNLSSFCQDNIYAFTLLKKCFYICSKEVSGNIQILLCFSQWSQKFYPHFRGRPFILLLLEVERRIGHWKVSLLKAGQCLVFYYFFFKMEENGVDWTFIYMTNTDSLSIY